MYDEIYFKAKYILKSFECLNKCISYMQMNFLKVFSGNIKYWVSESVTQDYFKLKVTCFLTFFTGNIPNIRINSKFLSEIYYYSCVF